MHFPNRTSIASNGPDSSMASPLHIGILVEARYRDQTQPAGLRAALQRRNHKVVMIDPEDLTDEISTIPSFHGLDLLVARGRSWHLLFLLAWAELKGLRTINRRASIGAVHNKAEMAIALVTAGLPTPRTFVGTIGQFTGQISLSCYPLILKPIFGDNCSGLSIVQTRAELERVRLESVVLAQQYLPSDGHDLKLYGIGEQVWAVRKPAAFGRPPRYDDKIELLPVTPDMQALGRRCAELFGLELYGADCIQTADGLVVIEVNDFPNYTGVPDADDRLANYITSYKSINKHRKPGVDRKLR